MTARRNHAWKLLVLPFLTLGGCSHEEHVVGESAVVVGATEPKLAGLWKVVMDGKQVGWVQTWRMDVEGTPRDVKRVVDMSKTPLGWMDDSGRAWRYTAHGGQELAGTSRDERVRVKAIMGMPEGSVKLVDATR